MIEKITQEELNIFEALANPISCTEIMFDDLANLTEFSKDKYSEVRKYQYPMLSFESLFFENPDLDKKQNFSIRKGLGDCLNFGGRLTGKSLISIIVDVLLSTWHKVYKWGAVSSCDAVKIRGIMESIIIVFDNHPIFKFLNAKSKSHPAYLINFDNNIKLESVNNNIAGKDPGKNWFQKHIDKSWEEEGSFLTNTITNKKLMAKSEFGIVERLTGMTNYKKQSPIGKKFLDLDNENIVINYPSCVNPTFTKEDDDLAIKEFGGKQSLGYKTQIMGEIVDDGESIYDIERIRLQYKRDRDGNPILIKCFEINQSNFYRYRDILILDRPKSADKVWIAIDKGEGSAPTEIIVLFENKETYSYEINITAFKLSPDEDNEIVDFIVEKLNANITGIDSTSGGGKGMFCYLAKKYNKPNEEHIVGVSFNEKIAIDFERDKKTNEILRDNKGNLIYKEEYIVDWSIQRLKHLFYNNRISVLFDNKLDTQFDNEVVMKSGQRTVYGNKGADHLHQSIPEDEIVVCKIKNKLIMDNIKNITELNKGNNIFIPSYNKGKIEWNEGKIIEEQNKGNKIYEFILYPGSRIKVTEGHSMLVWDREKMTLKEKLAKEVTKDDLLLSTDKKVFSKFLNKNKFQKVEYFTFRKDGCSNNKKEFNSLVVDEKLAYLLGMYCAEGSQMGRNQGIYLYVGTDENLAKKVLNLAQSIFKNSGNIYNKPVGYNNGKVKTKTYSVVYYGQGISELFSFICGVGAKNKKVPYVIFNSPKKVIESFLMGYIDGDGNAKTKRITSVSRILAGGINILNAMRDKYTTFDSRKNKFGNQEYMFKEAVRNGYWRNIPLDAFPVNYSRTIGKSLNRNRLQNFNYNGRNRLWKLFKKNQDILPLIEDVNFVKIKKIEITKYNGKVYDLSVENNHNFVAGVGNIIVHNSFQVFSILQWKYEFSNIKPVEDSEKPIFGIY